MLGFELAAEDYDAITAIDFQLRLVDGIRFLRPEGPFRCRPKLLRLPHEHLTALSEPTVVPLRALQVLLQAPLVPYSQAPHT